MFMEGREGNAGTSSVTGRALTQAGIARVSLAYQELAAQAGGTFSRNEAANGAVFVDGGAAYIIWV
jgi:hypothetical protein